MLPRMHYVRPFGVARQDILRHTAMTIVTAKLARSEPALGQELVQFMLDSDMHMWNMRQRPIGFGLWVPVKSSYSSRWLNGIQTWAHPPTTILVHISLVSNCIVPTSGVANNFHVCLPHHSVEIFGTVNVFRSQ
ncbi:QUIRKY [Olea europaea subsp. europaea]|uniref:QUIRKY n=1 Tax=Olea europaea subsp. europaea TaxID=158383 RepID=A0A8S0PT66_OLEEU|nr:QUIRKY [Olea europaea subsp. europaea]